MNKEKSLNFGMDSCHALYDKLKCEAKRLEEDEWQEIDCVNFIITAWHLYHDYLENDKGKQPKFAKRKKNKKTPQRMMLVVNTMRDIANKSKHLELDKKSLNKKVVKDVHSKDIRSWSGYFLHGKMIGVYTDDSYFTMWDLQYLMLLYFEWIFDDSISTENFPKEITEKLKNCIIGDKSSTPALLT